MGVSVAMTGGRPGHDTVCRYYRVAASSTVSKASMRPSLRRRKLRGATVRQGTGRPGHHGLQGGSLFDGLEGFDDVADLDVVEVLQAHAAFVALDHFAGVVLEALEGADLAGVDHHAVAEQAHAGVTGDLAVGT